MNVFGINFLTHHLLRNAQKGNKLEKCNQFLLIADGYKSLDSNPGLPLIAARRTENLATPHPTPTVTPMQLL